MAKNKLKSNPQAVWTRRDFLKAAAAGIASFAFPMLNHSSAQGQNNNNYHYKILIKNGRVLINGTLKKINIAVTKNNVLKLDVRNDLKTEILINAEDKIVCPGFIDILGDNNHVNFDKTSPIFEKYKISDGVTTVLQMHGGTANPKEWFARLAKVPHSTNYGASTFVMDIRRAHLTISSRLKTVRDCLSQGTLGVSHSIEYQPAPYEELVEYAKIAAEHNVPMFLHLRYSSKEKELDGVKEAIKLALETKVHIHMDHLNSTGGTFNMAKALDMITNARAKGAVITTCVYPYSFWATYSNSTRFGEGWQKRYGITYKDLTVVGTGEKLTETSFKKYRKKSGVILAVPEGTIPFEKTFDPAMKTDFCMIGSDGGIQQDPRSNSHPRGAGCFASALRRGIDIGIPIETMLDKVITLPASVVREMKPKAQLTDGMQKPDITIFNPKTISGKATVANPNQFSEGIEAVIVNGTLAFKDGKILSNSGKPVMRLQKI